MQPAENGQKVRLVNAFESMTPEAQAVALKYIEAFAEKFRVAPAVQLRLVVNHSKLK